MDTETALDRLTRKASEINRSQYLLQIQFAGDHIVFHTGARAVQQKRLLARTVGVLAIGAGLALNYVTPWSLLLSILGMMLFALTPLWFYQKELLQIDARSGLLMITGKPDGVILPLHKIVHVHGMGETRHRAAFYSIYVSLREGSDCLALQFPATDATVMEYACEMLGYLLNCPATCIDLDGNLKRCYTPVPGATPDLFLLNEFSAS